MRDLDVILYSLALTVTVKSVFFEHPLFREFRALVDIVKNEGSRMFRISCNFSALLSPASKNVKIKVANIT